MSGLTLTGFEIKTFEDIKLDIETTLINSFGAINLNEESVFGQITGIFTEREALLWLALEAVYNSFYPDTATGASLDGVAAFMGLTRLRATATTVTADLTGINQTIISEGSQAAALGVNTAFNLTEQVIITNESCISISINITNISPDNFTIIINSSAIEFQKDAEDTREDILEGLINLINGENIGVTANLVNDFLFISSDLRTPMSIYISDGMQIISITTTGKFEAIDQGFIPLPAGTLTTIQTPISGWISINNKTAGLAGRTLETDNELRIRRASSLRLAGSGTLEAVRAKLLNLEGVTSATVIENYSESTVNGRPPKSFECLVLGGTDASIALTIWKVKPAGIRAFGNTTVNIIDSTGKQQAISFSRPVALYIYIKVTITKDSSNAYPAGGDSAIKEGIVKQIKSLNVGEDVIYQSFYQSVYSIGGIQSATIEIGGTLDELLVPALSSSNIEVMAAQVAVSDISKIEVVVT